MLCLSSGPTRHVVKRNIIYFLTDSIKGIIRIHINSQMQSILNPIRYQQLRAWLDRFRRDVVYLSLVLVRSNILVDLFVWCVYPPNPVWKSLVFSVCVEYRVIATKYLVCGVTQGRNRQLSLKEMTSMNYVSIMHSIRDMSENWIFGNGGHLGRKYTTFNTILYIFEMLDHKT